MNCPICGREMPPKARKCKNCGCHPARLYGRPPRPKWIVPTALALVAVILAGTLLLLGRKSGNYEMSVLVAENHVVSDMRYSYDERGNLTQAVYDTIAFIPSSSSTVRLKRLAKFFYDENGVFTEMKLFDAAEELFLTGAVEFDTKTNSATVQITQGTENYSIRFQYHGDGRLTEIDYDRGAAFNQKLVLTYDEDGKLLSRKTTHQVTETCEMTYSEEGRLTGYVYQYPYDSSPSVFVTQTDEWGNVVSVRSGSAEPDVTYEYTRRTVSPQTARQYEMQLYLLESTGLSTYFMVFPIMKTPV